MALINRMSRLFTADVHAVLDRIEEPDVLLKHAIREMDEELARLRATREASSSTSARRSPTGNARCKRRSRSSSSSSTSASRTRNEELARKVVKRKLETERLGKHVAERQRSDRQGARRAGARSSTSSASGSTCMRQKAELLAAAPSGGDEWGKTDFTVGEDEVEVAFLREQQSRKPS